MTDTLTHETHDHGHHEPPEVVYKRQRMALWLFIGGDAVTLSGMMFTYLYLRGTDTGGHWMSMWGYQGHSYAWYENALGTTAGLPAPSLIHVHPMNGGFNWLVTLVAVVSALILWFGERQLRTTKNAKAFAGFAALSTIVVIVAAVLSVVQLRHVPEIFVANNDSQVMAYTAYSSGMIMFVGAALIHFIVLAFLGLGITIRAIRGATNGEKPFHASLVRMFWVWVAFSAILVSALTTTINTIH
jgi:heme/copper-type cytochrome/quinol oxidase subunit 3